MLPPRHAAMAMFLVVLLAGCAGGNAGTPASVAEPSSVVTADGELSADAGQIVGVITDEALLPLAGAQVAILTSDLVATTDDAGAFAFQNLAAGSYQIAAAALGYSSAAQAVEVIATETTTVNFLLTQVAVPDVGWVEILGPHKGFANCLFGTPVLAGPCPGASAVDNEKSSFRYDDHPNETVSIVGEMRWQQSSAGTARLIGLTLSYVGRPITHWWCWGSGTSPVKWQYDYEENDCITTGRSQQQGTNNKAPEEQQELVSQVAIPFTSPSAEDPFVAHVAAQQTVEVIFTLFQNELPDPAYSAFGDA